MFASLKFIFIQKSVWKNQSVFEWEPKRKHYRESSPYVNFISVHFISANFIGVNFITATFQNFPAIFR